MEMVISKFMWAVQGTSKVGVQMSMRVTLVCHLGDKLVAWRRKNFGYGRNLVCAWAEIFLINRWEEQPPGSEIEKSIFDKMGSKQDDFKENAFIYSFMYSFVSGRHCEMRGNLSMLKKLSNVSLYTYTLPNLCMDSTQWHLQMIQ